jgi:hypothetical protein
LPQLDPTMANPGRTCPIKPVSGYAAKVTTPAPNPTLADVLAAVQAQGRALEALALKVDGIDNKTDDLTEFVQQGFAHAMTEIAGVRDEVQRSEASVTARIADVQNVVRTLKADLSAHIANSGAHPHRHAA